MSNNKSRFFIFNFVANVNGAIVHNFKSLKWEGGYPPHRLLVQSIAKALGCTLTSVVITGHLELSEQDYREYLELEVGESVPPKLILTAAGAMMVGDLDTHLGVEVIQEPIDKYQICGENELCFVIPSEGKTEESIDRYVALLPEHYEISI